jgi:hypothetical protein
VYVADELGGAAGTSVPHSGLHDPPPVVSVHVSPACPTSFVTVALTATAGPPTGCDENLFTIETETGGATIIKLKVSLILGVAIEIAEIVGDAFRSVEAGAVAGG